MKIKLLTIFAVLLCATSAWAQITVSTDSELRVAIQNDGANIKLSNDINLSNSTLDMQTMLRMISDTFKKNFTFLCFSEKIVNFADYNNMKQI